MYTVAGLHRFLDGCNEKVKLRLGVLCSTTNFIVTTVRDCISVIIRIIIIRNLYSAIMTLGGYRGAGGYRGVG